MVSNRSYLHVNINVEIFCLTWNELGTVSESSPFDKDERKHSFLVTSPNVEMQLSLVPNIFITLTATAIEH